MDTDADNTSQNLLDQKWYVAVNGQASGPFPGAELRNMIAKGQVTPPTLVCVVGASEWTEASAIPALAGLFTDRTPPLPPTAPPLPASQTYGQQSFQAQTPASAYGEAATVGTVRYAGFWIRAAAYLIDFVILFVLMSVATFAALMLTGKPQSGLGGLFTLIVAICYYVIPVSGPKQATWGKQMLGLKIIRTDGRKVGGGLAFGRYCAYLLSSLPLGIGFFMVGWTDEKKAIHDIVCGTRVIYKN